MSNEPTFFVDRSLGKGVAEALRAAGAQVEIHDDHFAQDTDDETWITEASKNGWVILTKDKRIRSRRSEREALLLNEARVVSLTSGNMTGAAMAQLFVGNLEATKAMIAAQQAPFVVTLGRDGIRTIIPRDAES